MTATVTRRKAERADDIDRLRCFVSRVADVEASTLVRESPGSWLNSRWQRGAPVGFTSTQPSREVLESLLIRLRPLIQPGESVNMLDVHGICDRRLRHVEMREFLRSVRRTWVDSQRHGIIGLKLDERDKRPDVVADLMIIGYFFHANVAKRAELDSILGEARLMTDRIRDGRGFHASNDPQDRNIDVRYTNVQTSVSTSSSWEHFGSCSEDTDDFYLHQCVGVTAFNVYLAPLN